MYPRGEDLLRSRFDAHLPTEWIDQAQQLARAGYFQTWLIILTTIWMIAWKFRQGLSHASFALATEQGAKVPFIYEIAAQATRGAAAALIIFGAVQMHDYHQWFNVAIICYTFILGIIRLACDTKLQQVILHQVNILLVTSFFILLVSELLPQLKTGSDFTTDNTVSGAIATLGAANIVALITPRAWVPPPLELVDPGAPEPRPSLEETASWYNYFLTYEWITPLIWTGFLRPVAMGDLPPLPWYDEPLKLLKDILRAREKSKQKTLWTVLRYQRKEIAATAIWTGLAAIGELISPFAMYQLLAYIGDPDNAVMDPKIWLFLMFAGPMARSVCFQQSIFNATRMDLRIKSGLTQELYHRAISCMELEQDVINSMVSKGGKKESDPKSKSTSTGRLANLMASDIDAVYGARSALLAAGSVPLGVTLSSVGLYNLAGWPSLVGIGFVMVMVPIPAYIAQAMGKFQRRAKVAQDTRISLVSEYIGSIKVIKYFAWEDPMIKNIQKARLQELKDLWRITISTIVMTTFTGLIPLISLLLIFGLYVGVLQQPLTAQIAFPTVFLITTLRSHMNKMSWVTRDVVNAWVSLDRLDRFFTNTVHLTSFPVGPLRIKNATFRRNKSTEFLLENIDIDFVEGGLNLITGQSGTGKTTLLLSILGETILEDGSVTRPDDVAFASQTTWLQGGTIRENILFHSPYEELRYNRVVGACCLDADFNELPQKGETEVGENGTALSGGQRARVALARALYSKAPLLLLDDTFSALDSKTSASVWKQCFCGDLLQGRTTVLISQIPWMEPQADLFITMGKGRIDHIERNLGVTRTPVIPEENEAYEYGSVTNTEATAVVKIADSTKADAISSEMKASGSSKRMGFFKYILYFGPGFALFSICTTILGNLGVLGTSLWLSFWVDAYNIQTEVDIKFYLGIYTAFVFGNMVAQAGSFLTFKYGSLVAARRIHERCIDSVMNVSLSWWKEIPVGRVVNRFSRDVGSLDRSLPGILHYFLEIFISIFFGIGAISSVMPIFVVPALVACFVGLVAGDMYTRTAVVLRRLVASSQSPVFTQFSDSMSGLAVIRARSNMPQVFQNKLAERYREYSRAFEGFVNTNRWIGMRIDFVTALVSLSAGIIGLSKSNSLAVGLVGFSLSNAAGLSSNILNLVKAFNETELEMQSFYRLDEYTSLESEEKTDIAHQDEPGAHPDQQDYTTDQEWPHTGSVEFRNVTIRYDLEGPDILKEVNLTFQAGERVAIVGRTGAGKSTLLLALLRLTHIVSGQILYDGVDITAIPRKKLRRSLTIIPQEAVLFNGTIESNLDPFRETPKDQLQAVLSSCMDISSLDLVSQGRKSSGEADGLINGTLTSGIPEPTEDTPLLQTQEGHVGTSSHGTIDSAHSIGKLSLDTLVLAKGENFSHGQRQVLSLCRAMVRKSKLMVLDEATANMDYDTDRMIQGIIRADLNSNGNANRTLVTIAHRLRTIVDYDKIVVLAAGQVVEVGSPKELYLAKGTFHDMVRHSGEEDDLEKLMIGNSTE